jgi:hypothetical protein
MPGIALANRIPALCLVRDEPGKEELRNVGEDGKKPILIAKMTATGSVTQD